MQTVDHVVLVGVPGLTWSDIGTTTPTLLRLASEATSGSVVMEHRTPVPCATEAWLSLGAVAVVPGSATQATGDDTTRDSTDPSCGSDGQPAVTTTRAVEADDADATQDAPANDEADVSEEAEATTLADFPVWQEAWSQPPRQVALGSLATGLRAEEQCVAAYGPKSALATSDRTGVLGRFDPSALPDLNLARILNPDRACSVTLIDAGATDPRQLDERVSRIFDLLGPSSLLMVAGVPGGPSSTAGATDATRPVLIARTDGDAEISGGAASLWSRSARVPGVVQWTDLAATILSNANVPVTANMDGRPLTAPAAADVDLLVQNRELSAAITLSDRIRAGLAVTWAVLFALALGAASAWRVYSPAVAGYRATEEQRSRVPLTIVGLAAATLPVATLCASLLPWWRWGVDLQSADVASVSLFRPTVALVLLTAVFGALVVALAWGGYLATGRHPLAPVAVVAAVTVAVFGADAVTGGGLALRSVLGADEIISNRFYGLAPVPFGLWSAAVVLLAGCTASMLRTGGGRRVEGGRWLGVAAVVLLGLSAAALTGVSDWGADPGGVPAVLVGTLLLSVAAAGRRLSPSVLFLLGMITVAVLSVIAFADWLRPPGSRGTAGGVIEAVINGNAFAVLSNRLDRIAGVLLDRPSAWLIVALLVLAGYAVTARRTAVGGRLLPIWDQHLMRATGGAVLTTLAIGWMLNDSGLSAVAAGLVIVYGAGLSVAALGRTDVETSAVSGAG